MISTITIELSIFLYKKKIILIRCVLSFHLYIYKYILHNLPHVNLTSFKIILEILTCIFIEVVKFYLYQVKLVF